MLAETCNQLNTSPFSMKKTNEEKRKDFTLQMILSSDKLSTKRKIELRDKIMKEEDFQLNFS